MKVNGIFVVDFLLTGAPGVFFFQLQHLYLGLIL